jgi:hypothetical protein
MTQLFRIAEDAGICVEYCRLPLNESISAPDKDGDFILMDYSLLWAAASERVHFAHELGHCLTGSFYNAYSAFNVRQKYENRADKWAVKKLIPKDELEEAVQSGMKTSWELAEYFGVTEDFMKKAVCYYTNGNLAVEYF